MWLLFFNSLSCDQVYWGSENLKRFGFIKCVDKVDAGD